MKKLIISFMMFATIMLHASFNFDFSDFERYGSLPEKRMTIVVPMYKNHDFVEFCLESLFTQNYTNCSFIVIDDASPDDTAELIHAIVKKYNKEASTEVIVNSVRQGAMYNIYHAVWGCPDTDIIVTVDGDDRLIDSNVLKKLNAAYSWSSDVWLTHGFFLEYPQMSNTWTTRIPDKILKKNKHRKHTPHPSHLRTFYAKLFKLIDTKDLMHNGRFFEMTWDQAFMFPMIEMAAERHYYFDRNNVLYLYNRLTPINDNKVNAQLQRDLEKIIRGKKRYERIPSLWDYQTEAYRRQKKIVEGDNV